MLLKKNKKLVEEKLKKGQVKGITTICPNVVDSAIEETDKKFGVIKMIAENFDYCKMHCDGFKPEVFLLSMISAKAKKMFAITDVGIALTNPYALEKLGIAIKNKKEIMTEGNVRNFIEKVVTFENEEGTKDIKKSGHMWIEYFNRVSKQMLEKTENTDVHILDCVQIPVNYKNKNYEESTVINYGKEKKRGYKLGALRRVTETGGIIEYIKDGTMSDHDLKLIEKEIEETELIKENEYLVMDRGFISIKFIRNLVKRGIRVIIPAKKNMNIYQIAKEEAIKAGQWREHPNIERTGQEIALVKNLKGEWIETKEKYKKPENIKDEEIDFNACVIRISKKNNEKIVKKLVEDENEEDHNYVYIVILSTDTEINAAKIVRTYEQRTEIEEDFRQLKDQWDLGTFTSTKYQYIMCHISMLLIGYNIFSLYKSTEKGAKYRNKSMKAIMKHNIIRRMHPSEIYYFIETSTNFCILQTKEIFRIYGKCEEKVQEKLLMLL